MVSIRRMRPPFLSSLPALRYALCFLVLPALHLRADDATNEPPRGYYRFPAIHGDTIVFTAEGDLWQVGIAGGVAHRLTSNPGTESHAAFSPDGQTLAFSAEYEGPSQVYTMPADGGLPKRRTFDGESAWVIGWTPDGRIIYTSTKFSTLPAWQLATLDPVSGDRTVLPLAQASDGCFDSSGQTLYFTRLSFQGSSTKRYKGGFIQHIWKYTTGDAEAIPLGGDFPGTSKCPMWWNSRVYFVTDRDGSMNLWSMDESGADLQQLTQHRDWDVKSPSLSSGRIVYQMGPDLYLYDIAAKTDQLIPISLSSDFDQEREHWVKKPMDYLTAAQLSPDGDRIALTARGQIFVAPADKGRLVEATHDSKIRYRHARFMPDGKSLLALSDATGELEFWTIPANGVGKAEQLTTDSTDFRIEGIPSPDGKWIAYYDKNFRLFIFNLEEKRIRLVAASQSDVFSDLKWSPDSQWLAYVRVADNTYSQIWLYHLKDRSLTALTSDRVNSSSPTWSTDGKWLYFLSDRHLESAVDSPWGPREPEPYFDRSIKLYQMSLLKEQRSPFQPPDELHPSGKDKDDDKDKKDNKDKKDASTSPPEVTIDLPGIQDRVEPVPVPPGNYTDLDADAKNLFVVSTGGGLDSRTNQSLMRVEITNDDPKLKTLADDIKDYQLSDDHKKLMIHKDDDFYVVDPDGDAPLKLDKSVDLGGWTFPIDPREEWRQMFTEAWRLERDFFYATNMQGQNWTAVLNRYLPSVDRVTDRAELSDLISEMVGELSALHIFVFGGDHRQPPDNIAVAALGARLVRDPVAGGYRVDHIYQSDPDYPEQKSPLAAPSADVRERDIILSVNGVDTMSVPDIGDLLRNQSGRQVLLEVRTPPAAKSRDVIVTPVSAGDESDLRYAEWEYTRRKKVEDLGKGRIGYVHLRAMGSEDIARWARDFYPVFQRQGLIIDVRDNHGGNIDSWILEKLMRKAWFYWQGRVGIPSWNMQYAFRGHVVVICDQRTASDGEAFSEGFKRLGLGKVIGMRTWGGEIWLDFDTGLVDNGMATAAEMGVYGPEGKWLVEGHGVDPDIVVDDAPHETFLGADAQLDKAIEYLQEEIQKDPVPVPAPPPYPDKSLK
jgi:tricorn protease